MEVFLLLLNGFLDCEAEARGPLDEITNSGQATRRSSKFE
jgi:hypothetical protein